MHYTTEPCGANGSFRRCLEGCSHFRSRLLGLPHYTVHINEPNRFCCTVSCRPNNSRFLCSPRVPKKLQRIPMQKMQARLQGFISETALHPKVPRKRPCAHRNRSLHSEMPKMRREILACSSGIRKRHLGVVELNMRKAISSTLVLNYRGFFQLNAMNAEVKSNGKLY